MVHTVYFIAQGKTESLLTSKKSLGEWAGDCETYLSNRRCYTDIVVPRTRGQNREKSSALVGNKSVSSMLAGRRVGPFPSSKLAAYKAAHLSLPAYPLMVTSNAKCITDFFAHRCQPVKGNLVTPSRHEMHLVFLGVWGSRNGDAAFSSSHMCRNI